MVEYTATTTNATNKVTATATDENADILIMNGDTEVENGSSASWDVGDNVLTITVSEYGAETVYTVTVTREQNEG